MEEIIKVKKMTCDQCNKVEVQQKLTNENSDSSEFNGWFRCEKIQIDSSSLTDKNPPKNRKTFCCFSCMTSHYQ